MPDIQKIKLDFQTLYGKSKQNPEMPEEGLRTLFNKSAILENLGYKAIGKDIRLELSIKGKRSDIVCLDDYSNVVFVIEYKKPSDNVDLKEHFDQLWDRYVKPLRADFGALELGMNTDKKSINICNLKDNDHRFVKKASAFICVHLRLKPFHSIKHLDFVSIVNGN